MKKFAIAALAVTISVSSYAWGDREQGALLGLVIGGAIAHHRSEAPRYPQPHMYQSPPVVYTPQPQICGYNVYCAPAPFSCFHDPIWNQYSQVIGYRTICK